MTQYVPTRKLKIIEFYITNVCNLTCKNCNRFNNFNFRGWQKWQDYEHEYAQWAQNLKFDFITILGGEPLLNPTILEWCQGIRRLWPESSIHLVTNGYHMNKVAGLYETIRDNKILLSVTLHNEHEESFIYGEVDKFLDGGKEKSRNEEKGYIHFEDRQLPMGVWTQKDYEFVTSALYKTPDNKFSLHNSDPHIAHDHCTFANGKTYHFVRGKLYKCGPVALFPEFDSQHSLDISDSDRQLINSYEPFSAEDFAQRSDEILEKIDQPLPQCKFCPENYETSQIFATRKGSAKTINIIDRS